MGWVQVKNLRNEIKSFEKKQVHLPFRISYIENWNLWLNLKIIFTGVFITLKGGKNAF